MHYWSVHHHPFLLLPGGKAPYLREGKPLVLNKGGAQKPLSWLPVNVELAKMCIFIP
jgi:hypothetical protein